MHRSAAGTLVVVLLATISWAQGINDVYQVSPFFLTHSATGALTEADTVVIINTGQQGTPISSNHGALCADVYVFDANQEMLECCSCRITANGTMALLAGDLTSNPLTGTLPASFLGAIKIVSDAASNCDAKNPVPTPDLRAWLRIGTFNGGTVASAINMVQFAQAPLQADEQQFLGQACSFVLYLGSGKGLCGCGVGGNFS